MRASDYRYRFVIKCKRVSCARLRFYVCRKRAPPHGLPQRMCAWKVLCAPRTFQCARLGFLKMCAPRTFQCACLGFYVCRRRAPPWCIRLFQGVYTSNFVYASDFQMCVPRTFKNVRAPRILCVPQASTPIGFSKVLYVRLEFLCASRTFQWRASEFSNVRTSDIMCAAGEHPHSPIGCSTSCIAQRRLHRQFFMWCAHRPEINSKQKISHRNQCHPHIYPTMLDHSTDMHHTPLVWNTGDSFLGRRASGSWDASVRGSGSSTSSIGGMSACATDHCIWVITRGAHKIRGAHTLGKPMRVLACGTHKIRDTQHTHLKSEARAF